MSDCRGTITLGKNNVCKECVKADVCKYKAKFEEYSIKDMFINECEYFKDRSKMLELPCEIGSEVFVSPDNGNHFHKANLYGCDEKGVFFVFVNDNKLQESEKHIVKNPMKKVFYDWFSKVYSKEEAEQALRERENNVV